MPGMTVEQKWNALVGSIRKAAKICGLILDENQLPEYMNWGQATRMHKHYWGMVRGMNKKRASISRRGVV